ncbi:MAG: glycosyltransferase family 39 protein [Candidatus Binatia bacterium]
MVGIKWQKFTNSESEFSKCFAWHVLALSAICLAGTLLFFTAPTDGDFYWFEAPSHAMNGVFILDFFTSFPIEDPIGWAIDYYLQYPALSILFYPPLFYFFQSIFYLTFGVSHSVDHLSVSVSLIFLGLAIAKMARLWLPPTASIAVGVATLGLPEIALWGRQVMLEVPAYCMAAWGLYFAVVYVRFPLPRFLWGAAACLVAMLYIKQTAAFFVLAAILVLVVGQGLGLLRRRHVWIVAAVSVCALLPLAAISLKFGQFNAQLASGGDLQKVGGIDLFAEITAYARRLPMQAGWVPLILSGLCLGLISWRDRAAWRHPTLLASIATFGIGYVFFTLIDLKDQRYTIFILASLALLSVAAIHYLLPRRWSPVICLGYAAAVLGWTLAFEKVPYVDGFRTSAEIAIATAPAGSTVMFHGQRSAAFVFNLRALGNPTNLWVLRAEKLLVSYRQSQLHGYQEYEVTAESLRDAFYRYGVTCAVVDPGFWTNLANVRLFLDLLRSERFQHVDEVPIQANHPVSEKALLVYRNRDPVAEAPEPFVIDMPLIGSRFSGRVR